MGKVIVYLKVQDERELEAAGIDPAEWVREQVKKAIGQRRKKRR